MPTLEEIEAALAAYTPKIADDAIDRAAVAVVLRQRPEQALELIFIKRAEHELDPWSGHMAFPGGRVEAGEDDPRQAAERETDEEIGLSLGGARYLGRLDDLRGRGDGGRLVISAHAYLLEGTAAEAPLTPNEEVSEVFWFPVPGLQDEARHVGYEHPQLPGQRFPGVLVGQPDRHIVWGLTYRFIEDFLRVCGEPLPQRWRVDPDGMMKLVDPPPADDA